MEKTNKVGIFLNQNHINYYDYGMFLCRQIASFDNIYLHGFNNATNVRDMPTYDVNIYMNRYAYIRLNKLTKILKDDIYLLPAITIPHIVVINNKSSHQHEQQEECLLVNHLSFLQTSNYTDLIEYSHLRNSSNIGSSIPESLFISFDDKSLNFIEELKSFHENKKVVFYNKKIYEIGYEDLSFDRDKIIAKLSRNLRVVWNSRRNMWIKYKPKRKIKC